MAYDIIGDIHGHALTLEALLGRLGYAREDGVHRHPDRRVIFLGDFIDTGPHQRRALETVRPMVERGHALAVMGNHEFNALA
jgi:Calcineurin-like phosphoesterase